MGILQLPQVLAGQVGVLGAPKYMVTTDSLATVTTAGYLNNIDLSMFPILPSDILGITYAATSTPPISGTFAWFSVSISNGNITLAQDVSLGNVLLPVVSGNLASYNGTTGQIKDSGVSASSPTFANGLTLTAGNLTFSSASSLFIESFTDSITAATTQTQAAATQLTSEVNRITTCASIGNGVALPAAVSGLTVMVINHGANACQVYGNNASADTIDDVATGTGVSQMAGSVSFYVCATGGAAGKWYSEGIGTGYTAGLQTLYYVDSITTGTTQTQAGATALTGAINHITVNATAKNGVALPTAKPGMQVTVINDTSLYCQVYGNNTAADTINGIATGTGVPQAANSVVIYNCVTAGNWVISSNVVSGGSGLAGNVQSFPATASKGSLILAAVANTGNTNTTISNAAMGQASTISIPDPAQATGNFAVAPNALVNGNLVQASGTAGLVVDSGVVAANIQINTVTVSMNQASVQGAFGTPVQIVAAPGSGKVIIPLEMSLYTNFQSSAFAGGGVAILQYNNTVHGAGTNALAATIPAAEITAAASQIYNLGPTSATVLTGITNQGIFFSNATGAFTGGSASSTVVVTLSYYVITATV